MSSEKKDVSKKSQKLSGSSAESADSFYAPAGKKSSEGFHHEHTGQDIQNSAVTLFLDEKALNFQNWYHPEICHYLLHMADNKAKCIHVLFHDANEGDNTKTFKKQVFTLVTLSAALNRPALFVSKEPGADNHFICGLVKNSNLLLINPLGITTHKTCYQTLAELKREKTIKEIWLSSNPLQESQYEEEGLVSCGPIILELTTHILANFTPEELDHFWADSLKKNKPTTHNASGLTYYGINIKDLLPETLKELDKATDKSSYQSQVCDVRQKHCIQLRTLPVERTQNSWMPVEDYLSRCKEAAPHQLLFNVLMTVEKNLNNIDEVPEYKLVKQELNLQARKSIPSQKTVSNENYKMQSQKETIMAEKNSKSDKIDSQILQKSRSSLFLTTNPSPQINIFSQLPDLEKLTVCNYDNTLATSYGLYTTLISILGNSAHVIHPDLSSVSALMSDDPEERKEATINYAKEIAGYEANNQPVTNGLIHQDSGKLAKPIVMLLNTASAKAENELDTAAEGGSHWVVCVILPKTYQTPRRIRINNPYEKIYFVDPLFQNIKLPDEFKAILKYGVKHTISHDAGKVLQQIPAAFPDAEFIDCTNVFQQAAGSVDCGWWSLYNALEIVATGNNAFLKQFKDSQYQTGKRQSREFASRLRGLFPNLATQDPAISEKSKSQKGWKSGIPKNEMMALQLAIEESLKTFNTYKARIHAVPGRRGNDYQTLVLLDCALENYFKSIQFTLKTEVDDGTDFDDLELHVGNQLKKYQIKHSTNEDKHYTPTNLLHVKKSKLVNPELGSSTKKGAPLVHFFESWYSYNKKDHKGLKIEYALYTNYDFNDRCLKGLLNPKTKTFYSEFFNSNNKINGILLKPEQVDFKNNLIQLIKNLKIIKGLTDSQKEQKIIEFFSEFKFLLKQPYIDDLEKKIRILLAENQINEESIYYSLYYKYNSWLRTRLEKDEKRAVAITDAATKEMLIELEIKCKTLQRLIGQSQYYMDKTIPTKMNDSMIERKNEQAQLHQALDKSGIIFVKGEKGTGKSSFIKDFIETHKWRDMVLFFKDEEDFKIVSSMSKHLNLSSFLKYFSGIKLIVIDSAETWVSNYTEEKKKIFQALISQDQIPVVCTITENFVENFIEKYNVKNKKHEVISINLLTKTEINSLLKSYISETALLAIQSNKAIMNTCCILFWLNHFIEHFDKLSSELPDLLNERDVIEYISKTKIEGRDKKISNERKFIWFFICVQSGANINKPVKLENRNMIAIKSLEEDQILIKNPDGKYALQHDLYYDIGMRLYFDKKRKSASIEGNFYPLVEFVNRYIASFSIQLRLIEYIKDLYPEIQSSFPTISIYICAAIFGKHDEALKHLLQLINPKVLTNTCFMGSYYSDFYMAALCADNSSAIHILESEEASFFFDTIEHSSSENSETSVGNDFDESSEGYNNSSESNDSGDPDFLPYESSSEDNPYEEWYKYPNKYCFANFKPKYLEEIIDHDSYGNPLTHEDYEGYKNFDERPHYYNHIQYFILAMKKKSYSALKALIKVYPDLILKENNFGETPLHYATKRNNLELVKFLIEVSNDNYINSEDKLEETPLHNACYQENEKIVLSLLEAGAGPNINNKYGVTPFHIAIAKRNQKIIKLLFDYGADFAQPSGRQDYYLLIQLISDMDDSDNDDFILFLMSLFDYGRCSIENLRDMEKLSPTDKEEIIEKYQDLIHDQFNIWVRKKYSAQQTLIGCDLNLMYVKENPILADMATGIYLYRKGIPENIYALVIYDDQEYKIINLTNFDIKKQYIMNLPWPNKDLLERYVTIKDIRLKEFITSNCGSAPLINKIIRKFNNIKFAYNLKNLLNYTKFSDDHSSRDHDEAASQFKHYLKKEEYFKAIDCLSEIDAGHIQRVFKKMGKYDNDLKDKVIAYLTVKHKAWKQLAIFAFAYNDKKAKKKIVENYLSNETIPMLLKVALDNADDDMFFAICAEIQWHNDIINAIQIHFGNSNERVSKLLRDKASSLENSSSEDGFSYSM